MWVYSLGDMEVLEEKNRTFEGEKSCQSYTQLKKKGTEDEINTFHVAGMSRQQVKKFQTLVTIFGITMINALKYVQTCMVFVKKFVKFQEF